MTEKLEEMGAPQIHSRDPAASGGTPGISVNTSTLRQGERKQSTLGNQELAWTLREVVPAQEGAKDVLLVLSKQLGATSEHH